MRCYLSGKALRDQLLEQPVTQNEWLCPGRSPQALQAQGFEPLSGSALCFRDPQSGDLYWPWCAEQWDRDAQQLTLSCDEQWDIESVLAGRDLTIHAMARDLEGELIDPHAGYEDLREGFLRHVTPHFARHPDYLLSIAESAAELVHWGFRVAHGTYGLMKKMVAAQAAKNIEFVQRAASVRRVLTAPTPSEYFRVLHRCGALAQLSPALAQVYADMPSHSADQPVPPLLARLNQARRDDDVPLNYFIETMNEHDPRVLSDLGLSA